MSRNKGTARLGLKPSKAYLKFEKVMERSLNLADLEPVVGNIIRRVNSDNKVKSCDLLRTSIVLGVAAMDSYFTNVFAEHFVPYIQNKGTNKKIVELLERAGLNVEAALEIMIMARPYRRIRKLIENHLDNHVTQRQNVIDDLFLAFKLKNFSENVQRLKNKKRLLSVIERTVKIRHQIVHDGDLNGIGRLNSITLRDTKRRLKSIIEFVSGADELIQRSLK